MKPWCSVTPTSQISVRPLNEAELSWCHRLAAVLATCPERLELLTIGDAHVDVIERNDGDLADGRAFSRGLVLASISAKCRIHGVSG